MMLTMSGGCILAAYYNPESELERKVLQLIKAARKVMGDLCQTLSQ
ncbi:hypothetical protein [Klebsiella michiganensis]|nr:hypothetical protein [Klebsiella michiganensis]